MIILPRVTAVGIYNSGLAAKNVAVSKKRTVTAFELELPMEEGGISFVDDCSKPIDRDHLICAKPGQVRHTQFPFRCRYVHLEVSGGDLYDLLMELPTFIAVAKREPYEAVFKKLIRCYQSDRIEDAILLQSLLMELIYTLYREALAKKHCRSAGESVVIDMALNYIEGHLTEDLRLETVAEAVHLSSIYFHNCFKSVMGKTLRDYVEERRIKKAVDLLLTADHSITEVALACGFSSQSYFSYVFKRRVGKTPRDYVREINSKYEI